MTISVVIATRNRARVLGATLESLAAQNRPPGDWDVLIVDNGSEDDTCAVVEAAATRSPVPVVYLHEARSGKSHALNSAVARARGDLLVLTDDDVLPSPGWLNAYARAFDASGADFAAGRIFPLWEAAPPRWLSSRLYGALAVGDGGPVPLALGRGLNEQVMPIGANMAVRRHVIDRVGGWNPSLGKLEGTLRTGEDHEFALKMTQADLRGVYVPDAWVRHRVPADRLRVQYFSRWYVDNGAIVAGLDRRFDPGVPGILGVPRHLWRRAAQDVLGAARASILRDTPTATACAMRVLWFGGYARARWARSSGGTRAPRAVPLPRN